jgi:hypothetical protein
MEAAAFYGRIGSRRLGRPKISAGFFCAAWQHTAQLDHSAPS